MEEENREEAENTRPAYMELRDFYLESQRPVSYRDYLAHYFVSEEGAISWQWKYCVDRED